MSAKKSKYTISQTELEDDRAQRAATRSASSGDNDNPIWVCSDSIRIAVQFVQDPLDEDTSVRFREVNVGRLRNVHGIWSDASPWPGTPRDSISYAMASVPVIDYVVSGGKIKYTDNDPVSINGKEYNFIADIADPGDRDFDITDAGNCMSSWRTVVDVVVHYWEDSKTKKGRDRKHPQAGEHILLKFRDSDWKGVQAALRNRQDEEGDDLMNSVWVIKLTPGKMGGVRRQQAVAKFPQQPLSLDEVEPFDIDEELDRLKQSFLDHVAAAEADMYTETGQDELTAGFVASDKVGDLDDKGPDPLGGIDFDMLPVARLRAILDEAGSPAPARASRVTLLKMAKGLQAAKAPDAADPIPF